MASVCLKCYGDYYLVNITNLRMPATDFFREMTWVKSMGRFEKEEVITFEALC
jgi:hypothetical protein